MYQLTDPITGKSVKPVNARLGLLKERKDLWIGYFISMTLGIVLLFTIFWAVFADVDFMPLYFICLFGNVWMLGMFVELRRLGKPKNIFYRAFLFLLFTVTLYTLWRSVQHVGSSNQVQFLLGSFYLIAIIVISWSYLKIHKYLDTKISALSPRFITSDEISASGIYYK